MEADRLYALTDHSLSVESEHLFSSLVPQLDPSVHVKRENRVWGDLDNGFESLSNVSEGLLTLDSLCDVFLKPDPVSVLHKAA